VVLAVAALAWTLAIVQKSPCAAEEWSGETSRYAKMCYSDMPYLYVGRGFAELVVPFTDTDGRYPDLEYPVVIGYFAYGTAAITQGLRGWPDLEARRQLPAGDIYSVPGVWGERGTYVAVSAVLLGLVSVLAAGFLAGAHRGRPWDAMGYAAAPAVVLTGLINWDVLAVLCVAVAFWAWSRGRVTLAGLMIGLGTATKLYPLFILGALLVVSLRRRELPAFFSASTAAAGAWLAVNAPAMAFGWEHWKGFWTFNADRGADLGSIWLVFAQAGAKITPDFINRASWLFFLGVCVAVLVLGLRAERTPRIAQLAFLIVAGFLLVNKVYSPQYVLWLLPLAALARPRWRDLLIWQAAEAFYFAAVWWYLGGFTSPADGSTDHVYWLAIVLRICAEVYLMALVARDILKPWNDPVRADGLTDDPMQPEPILS
jgi:uncharacterized membrane protein